MNAVAGRLPPLHAPHDRELLARCGAWEVRRHASDDARFAYCKRRGLLHLQLWHPDEHISVLTPSRLTGGRFEIAVGWERVWVASWPAVTARLPAFGLPSGVELAALTMWLVVRTQTTHAKEHV